MPDITICSLRDSMIKKSLRVVAAVIEEQGRILICRRKNRDGSAGRWEFPGGKLEQGETERECLALSLIHICSHLETVCRTTFSLIASSSCESPFDFLIAFMFSFNIRYNRLSFNRYHYCMRNCPLPQATHINIQALWP